MVVCFLGCEFRGFRGLVFLVIGTQVCHEDSGDHEEPANDGGIMGFFAVQQPDPEWVEDGLDEGNQGGLRR